jgi:organic hydroperoxide reductase OsmC/OhrA
MSEVREGTEIPALHRNSVFAGFIRDQDGKSASSDHALEVKLATPKELRGGGGSGTNPEQLFAAGYSAN